ncbi:MAG: hypothetical protein HY270_12385 [Deltaproteobacteria bacterium]|nr:hypothetical protein [Deltaproteobacteria bacterium]
MSGALLSVGLAVYLLANSSTVCAGEQAPTPQPQTVAPIFARILPALRRSTKVPIRLPSAFPDVGQGTDPVYARLTKVARLHYQIVIGLTPDCAGETACRVATLTAELTPPRQLPAGRKVSLPGDLPATFTDAPIGAHVGDAALTWQQGGARYAVAVKAGGYAEVLKLAGTISAGNPR